MLPVPVSPDTAYATKGNIGHPGTAAQRTASSAAANADLNSRITPGVVTGLVVTAAR